MKKSVFIFAISLLSSSAFAKQSLQQALQMNPKLSAAYEAMKLASGVDCDNQLTFQYTKTTGPEGRVATTHQAACFDPLALNPTQLGQLVITFYGNSENEKSAVGDLIGIEFEIWK